MTREQNREADRAGVARPKDVDPLARAVAAVLQDQHSKGRPSGLYLVATPIGNLADITVRALSILASADVIYCEDTRHSRVLCEKYQITTPLKSYHEHNAEKRRPQVLDALKNDQVVALISDAGTPLISDPGYKLVRDAAELGFPVFAVPGPSAATTALTVSGLETNAFLFVGFLPTKSQARKTRIRSLAGVDATLVFYEAPQRVSALLADLLQELGDRPACIARELTKIHEDVRRGPLSTLQDALEAQSHALKGECVVVVGPPVAETVSDEELRALLRTRLEEESLKDAARAIADEFGLTKSRVYDLGVQLKRQSS